MKQSLHLIHCLLILLFFHGLWMTADAQAGNCTLDNSSISSTADELLFADTSITTADGWTHYYHCAQQRLLLSIFTNGIDLTGAQIQAGLAVGYGTEAVDLSAADYIDNDLWFTANRSFQITNAPELAAGDSLRIRFYFDQTDVQDVARAMQEYGIVIDEPSDLFLFHLTGNAIAPFSEEVIENGGFFRLLESGERTTDFDYILGEQNDYYYSEFVSTTSEISGGIGFLLFLPDEPLRISGTIQNVRNRPTESVFVNCENGNTGESDAQGNFACTELAAGSDYTIIPEKTGEVATGVSILDVCRLYQHTLNLQPLTNPYDLLAADVNQSATITNFDINTLKRVIRREQLAFAEDKNWEFVAANYIFPNPIDPFNVDYPQQITVDNLLQSVGNQNFISFKMGDIAEQIDYPQPTTSADSLHFTLDNVQQLCGSTDTLVVPLRVRNFQRINGFQFTLEWNPTDLTFVGIDYQNLPEFDQRSVNLQSAFAGRIPIAWSILPTVADTIALADETEILQLKFIVAASQITTAEVKITEAITELEAVRTDLALLPIGIENSQISFTENGMTATAVMTPVRCFGGIDGAIQLNMMPAADDYVYRWSSTGTGSSALSNLAAGTYSVTVNPTTDCPLVINNLVVSEPDFLQLDIMTTPISCIGRADGMATLTVQGGTLPYQFNWSIGQTSDTVTGLVPANYQVTATDANACSISRAFSIAPPQALSIAAEVNNVNSATDGRIEITEVFFGTPPFQYQWNTGSSDNFIENLAVGNYQLTITDGKECSNEFAFQVGISTAVQEIEERAFQLAPNPVSAQGVLQINYPSHWLSNNYQIEVYDLTGRLLQNVSLQKTISAPEQAGVYWLIIKGKTHTMRRKFVVYH